MSDLNLFGASPFDAIRRTDEAGEYWSARELMPLLGYTNWREFKDAIDRAKITATNTGSDVTSLFGDAPKKLTAGRPAEDFRLARYAAYLVAMNGDPRKREIAEAQQYFAVKAREAEVRPDIPRSLPEALRAYAAEVEAHEETRAVLSIVKPQAEAWTTLADTGADYSVREAAYILNRDPSIQTGQKRLFALLRKWRMIGPGDVPYADHAGRVTLRPRTRTDFYTKETVSADPQVRVTVDGLAYLHKRLGGTEPLDVRAEDGAA